MGLWGRLFAAGYDIAMKGTEKAGLADRRRELLAPVGGAVIEIGGGTGANLPYYGPGVQRLVMSEPEEPMARRLERKLGDHSLPVEVVRTPAEELPFDDASFDYAVSTLVLCTVSDPARALAEVRRVLNPDGTLVLIEHVRSEDPKLARWQDRLHGLQYRIGNGCNCNRRTLESVRAAGFSVDGVERTTQRKVPPIVRPMIVGTARPAAPTQAASA